jgi:hypothetical protein
MRKGIDASKWDHKFDWSLYDWSFVFLKVSEGSVIDPLFSTHWSGARGRTKRGGYHFFRAYVNPAFAVGKFVEYLDGDPGELPPVLDLEARDGVDKRTTVSRALTWLIECEKLLHIRPIVYISEGFTNELELYNYPDFADYELWLAQYPYDLIYQGYTEAMRDAKLKSILANPSLLRIPPTPKPFKVFRYYQWTAKLKPEDVPGAYTGTGAKLAIDGNFEINTTPDPQPEEPMPETIKEGTVSRAKLGTATVLQIRSSAGVQTNPSNDIGDLHAGDRVFGRIVSAVWIEFDRIIRVNGVIENTHGFASAQYMDVRDVPVEPPTDPTDPAPSLPAYFTAHDASGNELARYNKQ